MELSANDPMAPYYDVIDLTTNKPIQGVQVADDVKGIYIAIVFDEKGNVKYNPKTGEAILEMKTGKIKLVKKEGV